MSISMRTRSRLLLIFPLSACLVGMAAEPFRLLERSRHKTDEGYLVTEVEPVVWKPEETALIICDMWDLHTSFNATQRTGELAPVINKFAKAIRSRGGTIIHSPSSCMAFYKDHPARLAAMAVPEADHPPEKIGSWCNRIASEKGVPYPIDQSDGGNADTQAERKAWAEHLASIGRKRVGPWIREHPAIEIAAGDFITDKGLEVWNILEHKNIKNVMLLGVHANMCVLGRPFGLRRLASNGKNVVLVRDLTDTMYDPNDRPYVSHFTGTDRIVAYIEQTVSPSITSDQILGGEPFRFKEDDRARLAIVCSEPEYQTAQSLTAFAKRHLGQQFSVTFIMKDPDDEGRFAGLPQLRHADIMLLSVRRRALPTEQLAAIRKFLKAGKPIVGIRTASHAFSLHGEAPPEGRASWESFDHDIWGGHYHGHHGHGTTTTITVADAAKGHPILTDVNPQDWITPATLYEVRPLAESTQPLLIGRIPKEKPEPIAWTNKTIYGGRAFYTSLGHQTDFDDLAFRRLLFNSLFWALERSVPESLPDSQAAAHLDKLSQSSRDNFHVADGLVWEPVLAEPRIAQPVHIKFDEQGRLWVMEYRQYPYPAGLKMVSKDKYWRAVYNKIPKPPPAGPEGAGRLSIHTDTDGDGDFDKHTVFLDGLNIATSFARGRGGVFLLAPPYLLFYPDANRDDVPDGPPKVLLEGFGLEDTHSVANSLRWGPDGWLYACQGSTVSGYIRHYGSDEPAIASMGQLIWRYHPETKIYEIFAEGGGNAFGLEIDSQGHVYSGYNGGTGRGFYYIPGGYYQKTFSKHGPLSNPFAFGYYKVMKHPPMRRFTHDLIIYEEKKLPQTLWGRLMAIDPLQKQVTNTVMTRRGSTFQTHDLEPLVIAREKNKTFRPVDVTVGPDGAVYVADFSEESISHGSHFEGHINKKSGRLWRLRGKDYQPAGTFDLARRSSKELVDSLDHPSRWYRQTALRLLADRKVRRTSMSAEKSASDGSLIARLRAALLADADQKQEIDHPLDHLWALSQLGGLDGKTTLALFTHEAPLVRSWTIRLACDDGEVSEDILDGLITLAHREEDVRVQVQLACSARELPASACLGLLSEFLTAHDLRRDDPYLPLAIWWAIEEQCAAAPDQVAAFCNQRDVQAQPLFREFLAPRVMRRFAAGSRSHLALCAVLLDEARSEDLRGKLLQGFEAALRGRDSVALPSELIAALDRVGELPLTLRLRQGNAEAQQIAIVRLGEKNRPEAERGELARILGQTDVEAAKPALLALFTSGGTTALRRAALGALANFSGAKIAKALVTAYPAREPDEQIAILSVLVSRPEWSAALLGAIEGGRIDEATMPVDLAARVLLHQDAGLSRRARAIWPGLGQGKQRQRRDRAALKTLIAAAPGDPYRGERLFARTCGRCHTLFGEGGNVGPDLTSDPRSDLERLLLAIADPSAEIREGYEGYTAVTSDGRVVAGILADKDERLVVLREADGRKVFLPRDELEALVRQEKSLMPEGLLAPLTDQQIRDLLAYLRSSQPLNN